MRYFMMVTLLGCAMAASVQKQEKATPLRQVSDGLGSFSIKFFQEVSRQKPGQNIISSPLSADVVLSMAAMGAAGRTEKQMREALHLPADRAVAREGFQGLMEQLNSAENVTLELANKMYLAKGLELEPQFKELTRGSFKSEAGEIDVSQPKTAAQVVNDWVKAKTHSKIERILKDDDIDANTRMILLNAVYFKGNWAHRFKTEDTNQREFFVSSENRKLVPTMFTYGSFVFGELPELHAKFVELPYTNKNLKMVIIVPEKVDGLPQLIEKLDSINASRLAEAGFERDVQIYLPKFKVESEIDLKEPLQKLGMSDMFEDVADFSGISKEPLKIGKVLQKAFIEVNEEGSEAAAVTGISHVLKIQSVPELLRADRPFFYSVIYKNPTNYAVLFKGVVLEP